MLMTPTSLTKQLPGGVTRSMIALVETAVIQYWLGAAAFG
jgi:hypothetical protein